MFERWPGYHIVLPWPFEIITSFDCIDFRLRDTREFLQRLGIFSSVAKNSLFRHMIYVWVIHKPAYICSLQIISFAAESFHEFTASEVMLMVFFDFCLVLKGTAWKILKTMFRYLLSQYLAYRVQYFKYSDIIICTIQLTQYSPFDSWWTTTLFLF